MRVTKPAPNKGMILRIVALSVAAALLGGCASREAGPSSTATQRRSPDAVELLAQSRSTARTFETRLGLAVAAADLAAKAIANGGGNEDRTLYNNACAEVAVLSRKFALPLTLKTPAGTYLLAPDNSRISGRWDPSYFNELIPTGKIKNKALVSKEPPAGYGGALVGVHRPADPRVLYLPRVGVSAPVTAVLNTVPPAHAGEPARATLVLYDPSKQNTAHIAGATRPLAFDLSAPFGYYPSPPKLGILGLLRPQQYFNREGLFLVQPYDSKKIPLVLIHGLMSDPQMWLPVMADTESDPVLRGKYQFWVFAYPTGNPIGYSALELREALAGVYKVYPRTRNMVIVNHSLGGVITHLQVIDSSDVLVKGIFKQNTSKILALPDDSPVKKALIFRANPHIDRVVFVAAPHRGAPLAINRLAEFGASFIRLPSQVLSDIGTATLKAATSAAGIKGNFIPTSVSGLSPKSPLLISMNTVPMRTPFHSIIGVAGLPKTPLNKTSDTVVPYWSSHEDAALSEKIVPYPHTAMFVKPEATEEIKRILRLHLASTTDGQ